MRCGTLHYIASHTRVCDRHLSGEVAEGRGLLGQAEDAGGGGRSTQHAPALHHLAPAVVEQAAGTSRLRELVGVGDRPEDLGGAQLRVLGDADRVELDELGHLPRDVAVLHQSPPARPRARKRSSGTHVSR
jgi:hypothetical protein